MGPAWLRSRLLPERGFPPLSLRPTRCRRSRRPVGCVNAFMQLAGTREPDPWGARSRVSCCVVVLVDQSTEDVAPAQPAEVRRSACSGALPRHRRRVGQTAMRTALVVMLDVASQDANELRAADDQQLVQALP